MPSPSEGRRAQAGASVQPLDTEAVANKVPPLVSAGSAPAGPAAAVIEPQKHRQKRSTSWPKMALLAAVAVAVMAYALRNVVLGRPIEMLSATVSGLVQSVVASGRVLTPRRITIASETNGRVAQVAVGEGQSVTRGQLLVALEPRVEQAALAQASATLAQALATLRQLREVDAPVAEEELRQARANATQAAQTLTRMQTLKSSGMVGQSQLDDAVRNRNVTLSQVGSATLRVKTHSTTGSDTAFAEATVAQARAALDLAQVKLAQDLVLAPADGVLIARSVEAGDVVTVGNTMLVLAANGETQVEVQIDEKNLGRLALQQTALVSADAFPALRFAAVVTYINPGINARSGSVEVKLRVVDPPAYLRQDMTVSVDIETARRTRTLVLPSGGVHDVDSTAPWVLVVRNKRATRQALRLGLLGDDRVEVLDGIQAGEAVVPVAAVGIHAGMRVRAAKPPPP